MTRKIVAGAQFHEDLASNWSSGYISGSFERRLDVVRSLLHDLVIPDSKWLDAGCGAGLLTRELCSMGALANGIDASPKMIIAAQTESLLVNELLSFRQVGSIEVIDSESCVFDGVLCSSVIEYVESPHKVLGEFARVLKPGGKLLVSVPNKRSLVRNMQKLCRYLAGWFGGNVFGYLSVSKREFTTSEIASSLQKVGFSIDKIEKFDPFIPNCLSSFGLGSLIIISAHLEDPGP